MKPTKEKSPTPDAVKRLRAKAGLTQKAAAALVDKTEQTWKNWEAGRSPMDPAYKALFIMRSGLGD